MFQGDVMSLMKSYLGLSHHLSNRDKVRRRERLRLSQGWLYEDLLIQTPPCSHTEVMPQVTIYQSAH